MRHHLRSGSAATVISTSVAVADRPSPFARVDPVGFTARAGCGPAGVACYVDGPGPGSYGGDSK